MSSRLKDCARAVGSATTERMPYSAPRLPSLECPALFSSPRFIRQSSVASTICASLVCGALLLSLGCSQGEALVIGPTALVEKGVIRRIVVATGTLEPEKQVDVRSRSSGIIEKVLVENGDLVELGQILMEIEKDLIEVRLREVRAQWKSASIEEHYAGIALERAAFLLEKGTMPDQRYDDAKSRHERALAAVNRTEASVARLVVELRHSTIRSPLKGVVLDIPVEEGGAVSTVHSVTGGTIVASIATTAALHLEGMVDENEIAGVEVGQRATITTEAFGSDRVFEGVVRHISPIGKRIQNVTYFEVEIAVHDEQAHRLLPRMSGDADIVIETASEILWIPETALHYDGDQIFLEKVAVEPDAQSERLTVELGIVEGDRVQLVRGASEGDVVLLR